VVDAVTYNSETELFVFNSQTGGKNDKTTPQMTATIYAEMKITAPSAVAAIELHRTINQMIFLNGLTSRAALSVFIDALAASQSWSQQSVFTERKEWHTIGKVTSALQTIANAEQMRDTKTNNGDQNQN
jgi:hypothetical protein